MQTQDVREAAQTAVDQSKSFLSKQVDERSTQLGQQIESIAQDFRRVGDHLRETGMTGAAAGYVDQGVQLIERLAHYLEDADGERLVADAENYARRQPWALAGAALVLGFAASRFLKTSSARRYRDAYGGSPSYGTPSYGTPSYRATEGYRETNAYGDTNTYGGASGYGETPDGRSPGERYAT